MTAITKDEESNDLSEEPSEENILTLNENEIGNIVEQQNTK